MTKTQHRFLCWAIAAALIPAWSVAACAAEGTLPIHVTLVSCGQTRADLPNACHKDQRCCVFLQPDELAALQTPEPEIINLGNPYRDDVTAAFYTDPAQPSQQYAE